MKQRRRWRLRGPGDVQAWLHVLTCIEHSRAAFSSGEVNDDPPNRSNQTSPPVLLAALRANEAKFTRFCSAGRPRGTLIRPERAGGTAAAGS